MMQRVELCGIVGNEIPAVIKSSSRQSKVSTENTKGFMVSTVTSFVYLSFFCTVKVILLVLTFSLIRILSKASAVLLMVVLKKRVQVTLVPYGKARSNDMHVKPVALFLPRIHETQAGLAEVGCDDEKKRGAL